MSAIIVVVVVAIVAIVTLLIYLLSNRTTTNDQTIYSWGNTTVVSGCSTYQYPTQEVNGLVLPPTLSTDTTVVENVASNIGLQSCVYQDEQSLALVSKQCVAVQSGSGSTVNLCVNDDGSIASPGDTVQYYDSSSCVNTACSGTLTAFAVNFYPHILPPYCMAYQGGIIQMEACSAAPQMQMVYEEVVDSSVPSVMTPVNLYFRNTNNDVGYLYRGNSTTISYNEFYTPKPSSCRRAILREVAESRDANFLQLGGYSGKPTWAWLPAVSGAPRQLIYIQDIDFSGAPTSLEDLANWLFAQEFAQALYWGGDFSQGPLLTTMARDTNCLTYPFVSQHIDWGEFTERLQTPFCSDDTQYPCIEL